MTAAKACARIAASVVVVLSCLRPVEAAPSVILEGFVPGVGTAGDVVVEGNLAYVASNEFGLAIVDISTPQQAAAIGGARPPFYGSRVAVSGSLAVVSGGALGLRVVDVTVPTAPQTVGSVSGTFIAVGVAGQHAYALRSVPGNPPTTEFTVIDLSVPSNPVMVASLPVAGGMGLHVAGGLAFVAAGGPGVQIIDVSTPAAPSIVTTVDTPGSARAVVVAGGYAFVADNTSLQVIDIQPPASATLVGSLSMSGATSIAISGQRLYVHDGATFKIVSVSTPTAPALLGSGDATGTQRVAASGTTVLLSSNAVDPTTNKGGLYVVDASDPQNPLPLTNVYGGFASSGVAVSGSLAVASGASVGLRVVDVSLPGAPKVKSSLGGSIGGVARAGQYAYALLNVPGNPAHTDLLVIDLADPTAPVIRSQLTLAGGTGITVAGGLAYVSCGGPGLQIVDVSNPTAPEIVTTVDTPGSARGVVLGTGYAFVADNTSIQVIDVQPPATAFIAGSFPLSGTAVSAIALAGTQLVVIDGSTFRTLDVSTPTQPTELGTGSAYGAQAIALRDGKVYLARPAANHGDLVGGVYVVDIADPSQPQFLTQLIVPGLTRALAVSGDFVYAGDSAAVVDVIGYGEPTEIPTPPSTQPPTPTHTAVPTHTTVPTHTSVPTTPPTPSPTATIPPPGTPVPPTVTHTTVPQPTSTLPPTPTSTVPPTTTPTSTSTATASATATVTHTPLPPTPTPTATITWTPTATFVPAPFGSFRCYTARVTRKTTPFTPALGVPLVDRFGAAVRDVRVPVRMCTQVDMNDEAAPITYPAHLTAYNLRAPRKAPPFVKSFGQHVVNAFGSTWIDVLKLTQLLLVSGQSMNGAAPMPPADLDSFNCYKIRRSKVAAALQPLTAMSAVVEDQFRVSTINIRNPKSLCVPVDHDGTNPGAETRPDLLMCYGVVEAPGTPKFQKVTPVFVTNQLQQGVMDLLKPRELCVPSRIVP